MQIRLSEEIDLKLNIADAKILMAVHNAIALNFDGIYSIDRQGAFKK